jgi:hypothetical protein
MGDLGKTLLAALTQQNCNHPAHSTAVLAGLPSRSRYANMKA